MSYNMIYYTISITLWGGTRGSDAACRACGERWHAPCIAIIITIIMVVIIIIIISSSCITIIIIIIIIVMFISSFTSEPSAVQKMWAEPAWSPGHEQVLYIILLCARDTSLHLFVRCVQRQLSMQDDVYHTTRRTRCTQWVHPLTRISGNSSL